MMGSPLVPGPFDRIDVKRLAIVVAVIVVVLLVVLVNTDCS